LAHISAKTRRIFNFRCIRCISGRKSPRHPLWFFLTLVCAPQWSTHLVRCYEADYGFACFLDNSYVVVATLRLKYWPADVQVAIVSFSQIVSDCSEFCNVVLVNYNTFPRKLLL